MIKETSKSCDVVVVPAGVPRKPGMSRDDLFKVNADTVKAIAQVVAAKCPKALVAIITNPVNSCVPIAAEIMKKDGAYDPKRLFGVSTLDIVRARTFIGEVNGVDPKEVEIPVIGGHSGITIIPVLSQSKPAFKGDQAAIETMTKRIQEAGTEVVKAKAGAGSATLSMAYAAYRFSNSLLRGLKGEKGVMECSYVESKITDAAFFSTPLVLGKNGIEHNCGLPKLNDYEKKQLEKAIPEIKKNIQKGIEFAKC
uniref:Malate dehydrogenase, mitochondrial n=1 Tax=Glossina brevipalpis TaxID=37001 RepID=A0A1A9X220_9MUSC